MVALFQEEHRAETDRSADIRAAREEEIAAVEAAEAEAQAAEEDKVDIPEAPTRRQVISAGMASTEAE